MIIDIILILAGLVILLAAGESLVRGAVSLAKLFNIPTLLIGLTIVAFGTSAPEFVVTIRAVLAGDNGIAIGNIVGSNIANIALVLGVPAILAAIPLTTPGVGRHTVVMLLATALFAFLVYGPGQLGPREGIVFLGLIVAYIAYVGYNAMRPGSAEAEVLSEVEELAEGNDNLLKTLGFVAVGLVGLPIGGGLLVDNGAALARSLNVREELIGLTIVAFGTSLPELATVWAAAMKRQADVAVGNIIGSNIFNILFVGGAAGLAGTTTFSPALQKVDVPMMVITAVVLATMIFARATITRIIGGLFALAYFGYIIFVSAGALGG